MLTQHYVTCHEYGIQLLLINTVVHVRARAIAAEACMMAVCVLCLTEAISTKRRRLYSPSSRCALKALVTRSGYGSGFLPADPGTTANAEQPYLCIKCFSQVERILNLRSTLSKLEDELSQKLRQTAVNLDLQPSTSTAGEAQASCRSDIVSQSSPNHG